MPRALAGQTVKLEVQAGTSVKPEMAPPDNLTNFIDNLRRGYSGKLLVVTISTSDEGVNLRGKIVRACPRPSWRRSALEQAAVAVKSKSGCIGPSTT